MKFYLSKTIVALFILSLIGCTTTQKIGTLKPEPSQNLPIVFKTNTSFISMPMDISLKEIENQLNKSLFGLIYEDTNLDDDKTEMRITKTAPIQLKIGRAHV